LPLKYRSRDPMKVHYNLKQAASVRRLPRVAVEPFFGLFPLSVPRLHINFGEPLEQSQASDISDSAPRTLQAGFGIRSIYPH
jgi:hypothetical protein